jgi:hypothetical protein
MTKQQDDQAKLDEYRRERFSDMFLEVETKGTGVISDCPI